MRSSQLAVVLASICVSAIGCADDDDDTATTTVVTATTVSVTVADNGGTATALSEELLLTCEGVDGGLSFETALSSCSEARDTGQQLALDTGAVGGGATGAELVFSSLCATIQNDTPATGDAITIALATALHEQDVCPGDLSMIVPE